MSTATDWPLERYRPWLRVLARQSWLRMDARLRKRLDASDLVSETMLKAFEGYPTFQEKGMDAAEMKWLEVILTNVCKDQIDKARALRRDYRREIEDVVNESSADLARFVSRSPSPGEEAEGKQLRLRLLAAIDRLPVAQRDAFILRRIQGLSREQVATQLNCSPKAVSGLVGRATAKLGELLGEPLQ